MKPHLLRLLSGALVVACAAPGFAAVITERRAAKPVATGHAVSSGQQKRSVQVPGSNQILNVTSPIGCSVNGTNSFIGEALFNYAGGAPDFYDDSVSSGAGVIAGTNNESCDAFSVIGAGNKNVVGGDGSSLSAIIGAGSANKVEGALDGFIGAGENNALGTVPGEANDEVGNYSAIVAGYNNTIAAPESFIGAGFYNSIIATDNLHYVEASVIAGGERNVIAGPYSGISAGTSNFVQSAYSVIDGGTSNQATGFVTTIGGGEGNTASGNAATIGGGYNNLASGIQATVGGGYGNTASGRNAAILGGAYNIASGLDSFAAGNAAKATYDGTFVWSDYSATAGISATAVNQFVARAAGGFYLYSSSNLRSGVRLSPGSGSWANLSDRAVKSGIESVDQARILAKVAALPVSEWSYSAQGVGVRHIGPMAQDFRAAFGLGEDDKHISTVDEEGVALAAIKALQAEVVGKNRRPADLDTKYARLENRLEALVVTVGLP